MMTTTTRGALPMQLRVVVGILFAGAAICLYKTIRLSMNTEFSAMSVLKALPLIQIPLAIGLLKRMPVARIASMLWFAFATLSSVFVLMTIMGDQEPTFMKGSPGAVAAAALLMIASSIYGYFVLTRPTVTAAFATID